MQRSVRQLKHRDVVRGDRDLDDARAVFAHLEAGVREADWLGLGTTHVHDLYAAAEKGPHRQLVVLHRVWAGLRLPHCAAHTAQHHSMF